MTLNNKTWKQFFFSLTTYVCIWISTWQFFLSLFIYFERERERECVWALAGERPRERKRENPKQAPPCQCRAWCGALSHKLWDHDLSRNPVSDTQLTKPPRHPEGYISMARSHLYFFFCELLISFMNYPICCQFLSYWFRSILHIWRKLVFLLYMV